MTSVSLTTVGLGSCATLEDGITHMDLSAEEQELMKELQDPFTLTCLISRSCIDNLILHYMIWKSKFILFLISLRHIVPGSWCQNDGRIGRSQTWNTSGQWCLNLGLTYAIVWVGPTYVYLDPPVYPLAPAFCTQAKQHDEIPELETLPVSSLAGQRGGIRRNIVYKVNFLKCNWNATEEDKPYMFSWYNISKDVFIKNWLITQASEDAIAAMKEAHNKQSFQFTWSHQFS